MGNFFHPFLAFLFSLHVDDYDDCDDEVVAGKETKIIREKKRRRFSDKRKRRILTSNESVRERVKEKEKFLSLIYSASAKRKSFRHFFLPFHFASCSIIHVYTYILTILPSLSASSSCADNNNNLLEFI